MDEYCKMMGKMTPWDSELFAMVENLTGKVCEPKNGPEGTYFIVVDYSNRPEPDFVSAVLDAVLGRLGDRAQDWKDYPSEKHFIVHVRFHAEQYPDLLRFAHVHKSKLEAGETYCHKLKEIRAVQVDPESPGRALSFVGNGEWEISKENPGESVFHFLNMCGSVYAHAPAGSYIVCTGPERFRIVDKETFEKEYELK